MSRHPRIFVTREDCEVFASPDNRDYVFQGASDCLYALNQLPNGPFGFTDDNLNLNAVDPEGAEKTIDGFNRYAFHQQKESLAEGFLNGREVMRHPRMLPLQAQVFEPFRRLLDLMMEKKLYDLRRMEATIPDIDLKETLDELDEQMKREISDVSLKFYFYKFS